MNPETLQLVLMVVLFGAIAYFLMIRPQQKRRKEQEERMGSLEPGSRVMLISGIIATVKYLGEKQAVVEISPGVEMTVDKRAISAQPVSDEFEYAEEDEADDDAAGDTPASDEEIGDAVVGVEEDSDSVGSEEGSDPAPEGAEPAVSDPSEDTSSTKN